MDRVTIIMPIHNGGEHNKPAIDSIINNTEYPNWRLFLIESESTDGTAELCDEYDKNYENIKVFHTKKEGITKAINFGIDKAGKDDVMLLQNDVIIPNLYRRDWLTELIKGKDKELCGVVTTLNAGGTSGQLYLKDLQWVGTWSLYIPRETIDKVGIFDENFSPGPGDDIDYSYRVIKTGLRIYIANFWVDHHRKTENFNDDLKFVNIKNAGYFRKKHNIKPSWSHYIFDKEDWLLDDMSTELRGCFRDNGQLDDPATMLEIKEVTKNFNDDDSTIDVGANIGLMSLAVQKGIVYAFEPTNETFDVLKNNAVINEWKHIVPIHEAVYSKVIPYVVRYAELNGKPWMGMNKIEENSEGKKKTVLLDSYLDKLKNVKLIKIDTETSDSNVLKGASKLLDRDSPIIIIEQADREFLKLKGYKFIKKVGANSVWQK